jgi:hypothetical protein
VDPSCLAQIALRLGRERSLRELDVWRACSKLRDREKVAMVHGERRWPRPMWCGTTGPALRFG